MTSFTEWGLPPGGEDQRSPRAYSQRKLLTQEVHYCSYYQLWRSMRFCPGDRYGARESKALPKGQILRTEHRCGLKKASKRMKMWVLNDEEGVEVVGHPEFLHLGTKPGRWRIPG